MTRILVEREWGALRSRTFWNPDNYNTAGYLLNAPRLTASKIPVSTWTDQDQIYLEAPCPEVLELFYAENDLSVVESADFHSISAVEKLDDALMLLDFIPGLSDCVARLVRVISLLKPATPEEDVSYSHPELPFSIFVSVCNERSTEASARVAESILHEAMHLRLSLIQKTVEFLDPRYQDGARYFSPWRQQTRPANGVLHGIWVFRAILEFFLRLASDHEDHSLVTYSKQRIREIESQIAQVRDFCRSPALNATGKKLVRQLVNI